LRKLHREPATPQVASELLAEKRLDIRLIVNYENEQANALPPSDLLADVAARFKSICSPRTIDDRADADLVRAADGDTGGSHRPGYRN